MVNDFKWTIDNQVKFQKSLDALGKVTSDFRIPFRLIASDFYRSQKIIFKLTSEGMYKPLGGKRFGDKEANGLTKRRNAEDRKERLTGHAWAPILYGESGDLRDSTLSKNHRYSVFFLGRQELEMGTSVPYGKFHQEGTSNMHQRKFIFIDGGKGDKSKGSGINGRRERWKSIVQTHIKQLVTGAI